MSFVLPVELLHRITQLSSFSSFPILRLVCKKFNDVTVPLMFSEDITIRFKRDKLDEFLEFLESLANGTHPSVSHAKSVTIRALGPSSIAPNYRYLPDEEQLKQYELKTLDLYDTYSKSIKEWLPLAISSFTKATKITWTVDKLSREWTRECVTSGIARMPSLTTLVLNVHNGEASVKLDSLPPLQKLSIHAERYDTTISTDGTIQGVPELIAKSSAQLTLLEIHYTNREMAALDSFIQCTPPLNLTHLTLKGFVGRLNNTLIPHLRSLMSLSLMDASLDRLSWSNRMSQHDSNSDESSTGDIWDTFRREKIYLREITLDEPTNSFIQYLKSYVGLKSLVIGGAAGTTSEESDRLALSFYKEALSTQEKSLEHLDIYPSYEGKWCFGEHSICSLSGLVNLKQLSIAVIADSSRVVSLIMSRCAEHDVSDTQFPYNPKSPICLLMETASLLPKLNVVSIQGTNLARNRGVRCGNGLMEHAVNPSTQIYTHVTSKGPLDPMEYRFAIKNGDKYYMLQDSGEGGQLWYRCL